MMFNEGHLLVFSGAFNAFFGLKLFKEAAPSELTKHLPTPHHIESLRQSGASRGCLLTLLGLVQIVAGFSPPSPLRFAVAGAMALGDIYCLSVLLQAKNKKFNPVTPMDKMFHSSFTLGWCIFEIGMMACTCFEFH